MSSSSRELVFFPKRDRSCPAKQTINRRESGREEVPERVISRVMNGSEISLSSGPLLVLQQIHAAHPPLRLLQFRRQNMFMMTKDKAPRHHHVKIPFEDKIFTFEFLFLCVWRV
jgi:hypothetical protein